MRLAHPGQFRAFVDLHRIPPEFLQGIPHNVAQAFRLYAAPGIHNLVDLPLVSRLHQMGHKIVIISVTDHTGQHPAPEALILTGL